MGPSFGRWARDKAEATSKVEAGFKKMEREIELVATPMARFVAVGRTVSRYLERHHFAKPVTSVIHYSSQAERARNAAIADRAEDFEAFKNKVQHQDIVVAAEAVLALAGVPAEVQDATLARLKRFPLTGCRQKLIFHYKVEFEALRSSLG